MNCKTIDESLSELKVDSMGRIRNKSRVTDKIYSDHLKEVDSKLMEIRVFVAALPNNISQQYIKEQIDNFIYKKSIQ